MKISRRVTYALQSVLYIARLGKDHPVSCGVVARHGDMPERFLLQILRQLVEGGILKSARGVVGGYQLAKKASSVSIADLHKALDEDLLPDVPPMPGLPGDCRKAITDAFSKAGTVARNELSKRSLQSLLDTMSKDWPEDA